MIVNKLTRTANIIAVKLNKKNEVTPDVEEESKHTQRNNQYMMGARNLIHHIVYCATYNKEPEDVKIVKMNTITTDNEMFTDAMIGVLDMYMNHLIGLVFAEFSKTTRLMLQDFESTNAAVAAAAAAAAVADTKPAGGAGASASPDGCRKRRFDDVTIDDDDDDDLLFDGNSSVIQSIDVMHDDTSCGAGGNGGGGGGGKDSPTEKEDMNLRIVKKLHLTTLMELPLSKVLHFVLDKIKSKHFADRMIMEVLSAASKKLSKEKIPKDERVFYNFLRQDELKNSRYKDAAEALYKLACDSEFRRFRYDSSLNQNHDKTPLNLSFFRTMARFTEKVYAFSSNTALDLSITNFKYEDSYYDVITYVKNGDTEIFDVRAVNGQYLDCMSWQERLEKLPDSHIPNNYKKINLYVMKQQRWLNKLEQDDCSAFVYIRTASLGLGTLFVKISDSNKNKGKLFILNKRHKKMQKDHLYDGDVSVVESVGENYKRMDIEPVKTCISTVNSVNMSLFKYS